VVHEDPGDLGKAVENYGQAIILQTDNIDALINRILVYSKLGEHASAIEDMDRVVEINPTYAKAYLVRASAHAKLGLPPVPDRP
jgi:tetratricopeptide (TPR) repeat protein